MPLRGFIPGLFESPAAPRNTGFIISSSVVATLAILTIGRLALQTTPPKTIPSPRTTQLPHLSKDEQDALPYPPDVFPGARDVGSPVSHVRAPPKTESRANRAGNQYGTIRVYEWGPESGRKVLLIPGISTPCVSMGGIAEGLVDHGCRVMVLDLFGRGYSDGVADLPHDSRLYATEILLAITSSPLSWTPEGFSLIGYSLGGGIVADFASCFPSLVRGLVLLAPAGQLRSHHFGWQSRLLYSRLLPMGLLQRIVRGRLTGGGGSSSSGPASSDPTTAVGEEIRGARDPVFESAPLSRKRPWLTVGPAVEWQLQNHAGFVNAFVRSIQCSSIAATNETREAWAKLGQREDKVLIFAGSTDPIM